MRTISGIFQTALRRPKSRLIGCIVSVVWILVAIYWWSRDAGYQPIVAVLGGIAALLTFIAWPKSKPDSKGPSIQPDLRDHPILVVGSAVVENVLTVPNDIQIGEKQPVSRKELVGGSGVNYTCRLMCLGIPVLPILPLKNDLGGQKVRDHLFNLAQNSNQPQYVTDFIQSDDFFWNEMKKTPQSTILISGKRRSIFTEEFQGGKGFRGFVANRINVINKLAEVFKFSIGAVMIGHVQADKFGKGSSRGNVTRYLLKEFGDNCKVFANFGKSQYQLGNSFWKTEVKKVTLFQLSLSEAKEFFEADGITLGRSENPVVRSLDKIISWFSQEGITAVITLDKFGAIATVKTKPELIYFAWPFEIRDFVDSTGAGDAFLSGLVSELFQEATITDDNFLRAIEKARICAAYACREEGAANNCPTQNQLDKYRETLREFWYTQRVKLETEGQLVLKLLDKAFS